MTSVVTDQAIDELHRRGDCYVSLCRGEGWGIGAFDAASQGKPVVMTGFGGQLDYLDRNLAYLVNYSLVPVDEPAAPKSYSPDQQWAEPDVAHGARLLRAVMAHRDEADARGRALCADVLARFNARAVIDPLMR
jgi:glycosyltransferase involved in cell wall biosynthesis